jgi:hypothetical protein
VSCAVLNIFILRPELLVMDGSFLNNLIPMNCLIPAEVSIQHMRVIFISCVRIVYAAVCLKLYHVHNE